MPSTNAKLEISYAITVVKWGIFNLTVKHLLQTSVVSEQRGTGFDDILDAGGERPWFVCDLKQTQGQMLQLSQSQCLRE